MRNFLRKIILTPLLWLLTRIFIYAIKHDPEYILNQIFELDVDLDNGVHLFVEFNIDGVEIYDENDKLIKVIPHHKISESIDAALDK